MVKRLPHHKITAAERDELIALYAAGETEKLHARQKEFGVERKYTAKRAYERGLRYTDPRWQRAIERGAVLA